MLEKPAAYICQSEVIRKALSMLELMGQSSEDQLIFNHVTLMLEGYDEKRIETEKLLCSLISLVLSSFSTHVDSDDALTTQIKMLQFRLMAPVTHTEHVVLQHYIESCADLITQKENVEITEIEKTLEPLLGSFGLHNKKAVIRENIKEKNNREFFTKKNNDSVIVSSDAIEKQKIHVTIDEGLTVGLNVSAKPSTMSGSALNFEANSEPNSVSHSILSAMHRSSPCLGNEISDKSNSKKNYWEVDVSEFGKSLKQLFSNNYLENSIEQSEKFGALLEVELATLKHQNDPVLFEDKKNQVLNELEIILKGHQEMTQHFHRMSEFISVVKKDSVRLNDELDRVTLLSLTDDLTGLPNRRAFLQRLNDEVGRAKRYGHYLSLAMIDLDNFKPINDLYGHHAGDAVLSAYSNDVMSMFREQDMVARYGGEEFIVIFPDTSIPGALQALSMVQQRAESTIIPINGKNIALPTFSAGLISYEHDESTSSFIKRVDEALYEAKNKGRNRIVVKEPVAHHSG